jgi:hypothetical protein
VAESDGITRLDQVLALAPTDIDAVPPTFIEREPGDGKRLAPGTGLLDPVVTPA